MNVPEATACRMNPRPIETATPLIVENQSHVNIVYPGLNSEYAELAKKLENTIFKTTGIAIHSQPDTAVIPQRGMRLPDSYRQQSLILLGSLNTNRLLMPLYASFYCVSDAVYPGEDGYELRTIVNPFGTGANVVLAGGSSFQGVVRAVKQLVGQISELGQPGKLTLPFQLDIQLSESLKKQFYGWPETPLDVDLPNLEDGMKKSLGFNAELTRAIGAYGIMYWWTGDRRFGEYARDCLRMLNQVMPDSYGDWHYRAERILVALPLLIMGGLLNDTDIQRTDELLLGTALATADMWWRLKDGQPPLGHRHHGQGTYEFYLLARYLRFQGNPSAAARALCDQWIAECETFLDALGRTCGTDDQDDESVLNNMSNLFWYALITEKFEFYESGDARRIAERALALHDNKGAGCGQGGYGESQGGAMYMQQQATAAVAACSFYYQDPELKWIYENLPNLKTPCRASFLSFAPPFVHKFDSGDELDCIPPRKLSGINLLPVTDHQYAINTNPPLNYEPRGHLVNAPETWELGEGMDRVKLPQSHGFDKMVFRNGFSQDNAYLLLQGYQGGYRWQGHMHAANCIVRFFQFGHIWLVQNTGQHSRYFKNGVFISDGYNQAMQPPIAECRVVNNFQDIGMSVTGMAAEGAPEWNRHMFWSKTGNSFFVIIDAIKPAHAGEHSLTCTWRTPFFAKLQNRSWHSVQGKYRFTLVCSQSLKMINESCDAADKQGAANPFVLRQFQSGDYQIEDQLTFENLFYVRERNDTTQLDIQHIRPGEVVISENSNPMVWCAIADGNGTITGPGFVATALSAWLTPETLILAGTQSFKAARHFQLHSDVPVTARFDFLTRMLTVQLDDAAPDTSASISIQNRDKKDDLVLDAANPIKIELDGALILNLTNQVEELFTAFAGETVPETTPESESQADFGWQTSQPVNDFKQMPERIREVTVAAVPEPVDGFPEQLIDAVVPEVREISQQWPEAEKYQITLDFPKSMHVSTLRILGDSRVDPLLKTFRPLPKPIAVSLSHGPATKKFPANPKSGDFFYKRYRDMGDTLEMLEIPINESVNQIAFTVPAPSDNQPLILNEIEIYGNGMTPAPIYHLLTADVNADGEPEILIATAANELTVLRQNGSVLWRQQFEKEISHLSCHELDGDGRLWICLGLHGGVLEIWSGEGERRKSLPIAAQIQKRTDAYFGWFGTLNSVGVWHRDAKGRAWLALGGYAMIVFLNPEGEIMGHSFADGPWQTDILWAEKPDTEARDLWVRSGWNHGIFYYQGRPGIAPSGVKVNFGGVDQPMFRSLEKVIPFVNGKTTTFEWLNPANKTQILAAAENGIGVLDTTTNAWRWKIEGRTPITACMVLKPSKAETPQIIYGSTDGFITCLNADNGSLVNRKFLGAPVIGLGHLKHGKTFAAATREGVWALDENFKITAFQRDGLHRIASISKNTIAAIREDYSLVILHHKN